MVFGILVRTWLLDPLEKYQSKREEDEDRGNTNARTAACQGHETDQDGADYGSGFADYVVEAEELSVLVLWDQQAEE